MPENLVWSWIYCLHSHLWSSYPPRLRIWVGNEGKLLSFLPATLRETGHSLIFLSTALLMLLIPLGFRGRQDGANSGWGTHGSVSSGRAKVTSTEVWERFSSEITSKHPLHPYSKTNVSCIFSYPWRTAKVHSACSSVMI